ncbi:helix-turn-helix transcriptional regulator [Olivibacter sp. SDN3]|uniref:winged helix-turn-helix transcriptional regulator n=1 Tax=Olivibacter sp. SDN3 TaxID=2764720 RepID=UPI0016510204|nr:helix-turn-helix domain-containing protein [Olivibacter sp. SDN3]QNL51822.1 helix-turn-helix transcriptional regulator [Olivibacter sp. SDN3]
MYERKMEEDLDCGIRAALKVFGGKWKLCIIDAIKRGIVRPVEIHKSIPGSTLRVIEMQLADLFFFGVVDRETEEVYPKKTEYRLTELGSSILPLLSGIDNWGNAHADYVKDKAGELQRSFIR